jgi:GTP cyclohydrolase I
MTMLYEPFIINPQMKEYCHNFLLRCGRVHVAFVHRTKVQGLACRVRRD